MINLFTDLYPAVETQEKLYILIIAILIYAYTLELSSHALLCFKNDLRGLLLIAVTLCQTFSVDYLQSSVSSIGGSFGFSEYLSLLCSSKFTLHYTSIRLHCLGLCFRRLMETFSLTCIHPLLTIIQFSTPPSSDSYFVLGTFPRSCSGGFVTNSNFAISLDYDQFSDFQSTFQYKFAMHITCQPNIGCGHRR